MRSLAVLTASLVLLGVASSAHAQMYAPNMMNGRAGMEMYEHLSHQRWERTHDAYLGKMGPVRKTFHVAREVVDTATHIMRESLGDPDVGYYTRWDRRPIGMGLSPVPGAVGGGAYMGGVVSPVGVPVMNGMPGMIGTPYIAQPRVPVRYDTRSHLFW